MAEPLWYVYLLECADESLYTGITNDLEKRMDAHRRGTGSKYVRGKGFGRLLHALVAEDKSDAARIEYRVKSLERNEKITFFMRHETLLF